MALHHLAEALARIEHKLDAILKACGIKVTPMEFIGDPCPGCGQLINYQIDPVHSVVVRRCGCKTGKVPPTFNLSPSTKGANNAGSSGSKRAGSGEG